MKQLSLFSILFVISTVAAGSCYRWDYQGQLIYQGGTPLLDISAPKYAEAYQMAVQLGYHMQAMMDDDCYLSEANLNERAKRLLFIEQTQLDTERTRLVPKTGDELIEALPELARQISEDISRGTFNHSR